MHNIDLISARDSLFKILKRKKIKLSIVESCTGGFISSLITDVSGSSEVFDMGLVLYSNQNKVTQLKIDQSVLELYGAVSSQCTDSMAYALSNISGSDINVAVSGIAGSTFEVTDKPIGLVYITVMNLGCKDTSSFSIKATNKISYKEKTAIKIFKLIEDSIL